MPQPNLTPEATKALFYLLDGQGQVSITHDRPPNGAWFVEVTDVWTEMITRIFSHPDLSVTLMKAVAKKVKVLGLDLDEILNPFDGEPEETEEEEEDE